MGNAGGGGGGVGFIHEFSVFCGGWVLVSSEVRMIIPLFHYDNFATNYFRSKQKTKSLCWSTPPPPSIVLSDFFPGLAQQQSILPPLTK